MDEAQQLLICWLCFCVQDGIGREGDGAACPNCLEGPLSFCVAVPASVIEERSGDYIKAVAVRALQVAG
jgi:hypothetical protein